MREERRRRWWLWLAVPLAALVVLLSAALIAINVEPGKRWLLARLMPLARETVPGLEVGELAGFLPFNVVLRDIQVADDLGRPAVQVQRVTINPNLLPLLIGELVLEEVAVHEPRVTIQPAPDGGYNIQDLVRSTGGGVLPVIVEHLAVRDGTVAMRQEGSMVVRASPLMLNAALSYRPEDETIELNLQTLRAQLEGGGRRATLTASAEYSEHDSKRHAQLSATVDSPTARGPVHLNASLRGPPSNLTLDARVQLPDRGTVTLDARGDISQGTYRGTLVADAVDPSELNPEWPRGDFTLHAQTRGAGSPVSRGGRASLLVTAHGDLAGASVAGFVLDASMQGGRWQLEQKGTVAGVDVAVDGEGTLARASLDLRADTRGTAAATIAGQSLRLGAAGAMNVDATFADPQEPEVTFDGTLNVARAVYGNVVVRGLELQVRGDLRRDASQSTVPRGNVTVRTDQFVLNGTEVQGAHARAQLTPQQIDANGEVIIGLNGTATSPAAFAASIPLQQGPAVAWDEPISATVRWMKADLATLTQLAGANVTARGSLWLKGTLEGTLNAPVVRVRADWVNVRGVLEDAPPLDGWMWVRGTDDSVRAHLVATRDPDTEVNVLDARLTSDAGLSAWLRESPWHQSIAATAVLSGIPFEWLPGTWQGGELAGELTLAGSLARPRGTLEVSAAGAPGLEPDARLKMALNLEGRDDQIEASVRAAVGQEPVLTASGILKRSVRQMIEDGVRSAELDVEVALLDFPMALTQSKLTGPLAGEIWARGTVAAPRVDVGLSVSPLGVEDTTLGTVRLTSRVKESSVSGELALEQEADRKAWAELTWEVGSAWRITAEVDGLDGKVLANLVPALAPRPIHGHVEVKGSVRATEGEELRTVLDAFRRPVLVRADAELRDLDLAVYLASPAPSGPAKPPPSEFRRLDDVFEAAIPFHLSSLVVKDSQLELVDGTEPETPSLTLGEVAATVENLGTREYLVRDSPSVLTFRGVLAESGEITTLATLDLLAEEPVLTAQASLRGLELPAISDYLASVMGLRLRSGTFSAFAVFQLDGVHLEGGVKPIIREPEMEPAEDADFFTAAGIELADLVMDVVDDDRPGRDVVATIIPINSDLSQTNIQVVPTLLGIVRNAFVEGLAGGFGNVPPQVAAIREPFLKQAAEALSQRASWPEAQPQ